MAEYKIWQPMKYSTAKDQSILNAALASEDYCIQLKMDGASYVWAKDLDGSVHLYGDKISKKTNAIIDKIDNFEHMKKYAEDNFPLGTQFIVEICAYYDWKTVPPTRYEHSKSTFVTSITGALPKKANERQAQTELCEAYVFDILYWDNESYWDKDFAERLQKAADEIYNMPTADWLSTAITAWDNKQETITKWLADGNEGGVLKLLHSKGKYSAKQGVREIGQTAYRPAGTSYKIKQVDTVDLFIIGIQMPTKEYTGHDGENYPYQDEEGNPVNRLWYFNYANGFVVGAYDDEDKIVEIGTVASGLDDTIREDAAKNPKNWLNKVIEISCMSIDRNTHTIRHPVFKSVRTDREMTDIHIGDQI
jgi:hypothetical protein